MSEQTNEQPKKRSAAERITDLENAIQSLFQLNDNIVRDVMNLKDALKLLNNKVDAMTKASVAGEEMSNEVLSRIMLENNVEELANKVDYLVKAGTLVAEEEVHDQSFVVGRELDKDGKVLNPRLQFALMALHKDLQDKIRGKKRGETVQINETLQFYVSESYTIVPPKTDAPAPAAPDALQTAPAQAPAPLAAVPSTSQSEPTPTQSN